MYEKGKIKVSYPSCSKELEDWDIDYNTGICIKCNKNHNDFVEENGDNILAYLPHS